MTFATAVPTICLLGWYALQTCGVGPSQQVAHMKLGNDSYQTLEGLSRYSHFDTEPNEQDKSSAMLAGGDVKCDVCRAILTDVMENLIKDKRLGSASDQDKIFEALEADSITDDKTQELARDMKSYVKLHRRGCNKLFKDSYLSKGFNIRACHKLAKGQSSTTPEEIQAPWACEYKTRNIPSVAEMDTYSVQKEAIFYACESTIGKYRDDLSEHLAAGYQKLREQSLKELVTNACRKTAKCTIRKPSESAEARVKELERRRTQTDDVVDEEVTKLKKVYKKEQKNTKRRAGKGGPSGQGEEL